MNFFLTIKPVVDDGAMFDLGARVVCIDDKFPQGIYDIYNALPKKGKVYHVRDVVPAQTFGLKETCAILLEELPNNPNKYGIEPGFLSGRFREVEEDKERKAHFEEACEVS